MARQPLSGEPIWPQGNIPFASPDETPGGFGSSGVYGGFGRIAPPPGVRRYAGHSPRALMWGLLVLAALVAIVASAALFALANSSGSGGQNNGHDGHGSVLGTSTGGARTPSAGQTPTATATLSPTPTLTPSPSPTVTPTVNPTPTVTPTPSPPCLLILPLTLSFSANIGSGNDPPSQNLSLQNCSNQISSWSGSASTTDGAPWLNFAGSPDTQNVSFTMNPGDTLKYAIDAQVIENNLSPGSYSGALTFTSSDGSKTVTITVSLTVTS